MRKTAAALLITLFYSFSTFSYSYNAFSLMTGKNTFAVNPYLSVSNHGIFNHNLFLAYGIIDRVDIWLNFSVTPQSQAVDASAMLRVDASGKGTILAIMANGSYISPQFHYNWENNRIIFQTNVNSVLKYKNIEKPSFFAVFSPAVKFLDGLVDVYCEVNPGYYSEAGITNNFDRNSGFGLDFVPGIGFCVGRSLFSVGCPVYDITNAPKASFGAWWLFTVTKN